MDLAKRISKLSSEQRKLFEKKLAQQRIDILQLPVIKENRAGEQFFPLSFGQERLWFIQQLEPENITYNLVRATKLAGKLDKNALEKSIGEIIRRHEILRTIFVYTKEKPAQVVLPELSLPLEQINLEELTAADREKEINRIIYAGSSCPFDLSNGPCVRTKLLKLSENEHVFLLVIHHIISDGTSIQIFIKELVQLYQAFSRDQESPLAELSVQYIDFTYWQRRWFGEGAEDIAFRKKQENFWIESFSDQIPVLTLPYDHPRPAVPGFSGETTVFSIKSEETRNLKQMALGEKTTIYVVLLTIYNIFLAKLSGMEDIIIGSPVSGRRHPDVQNLIGMFVNTLALRNYPEQHKTFADFLPEVSERTINAFENQEYRYEDIIRKVKVSRDTSRNPLFDVMFFMKNVDYAQVNIPGLTLSICDYERKTSMFDLSLSAYEQEDILLFSFEYCTNLFKAETIARFTGYFKQLLRSITNHPDLELSRIDILPDGEKKKILFEFNDTVVEYPKKTIHRLIEEQAAVTPEQVAVIGDTFMFPEIVEEVRETLSADRIFLTYRRLNERSNQLARHLRSIGISGGSIVAIFVDRTVDLLIAIFAVLKTGGMYLPLDPAHPGKRIDYILKTSDTAAILTNNRIMSNCEFNLVNLDDAGNYNHDRSNLEEEISAREPAYVIYTSGTTGVPKGVVIEHKAMANFIVGMTGIIDFNIDDTILSLTTPSFDIFGLETLLPLSQGCTVVIGNNEEQIDPAEAASTIEKQGVTIFQVTPSRLQLFCSREEAAKRLILLRYLLVGGEAFPERLLQEVRPLLKGKIINLYGPTETTIWSSAKNLSGETPLNIGKPIANTGIYILDKYLRPVPIGVVGEICIAGDGVARGYLNKPELTAEKFIHFASWSSRVGYRLTFRLIYKTGDLGRRLPDGNIDCLGRIDHQVKIRGFRIELEEIEGRLMSHEGIKEAVVDAKEDNMGNKFLCAYYLLSTSKKNEEPDVSELREFLSIELPDYMIPSFFVPIKSIPLTPNKKIDRKALPDPGAFRPRMEAAYIKPNTELENKIAELWKEVLNVDRVGLHDNFFELGGHSMNVILINNRLKEVLGKDIPVVAMFQHLTVSSIAHYIKERDNEVLIKKKEKKREETLRHSKTIFKDTIKRTRRVKNGRS
jgi:amino acid adenylation domain-containing protein